jgi:uncharacterized protein (TIGR02996 family)
MKESDALLRAVIDQPAEDAPRLVYADWLDEHGQPDRAEFIRTQIALSRRPEPSGADDLRRRGRELLAAHEAEWTVPLHGVVRRARFVRGFPECVTVPADVIAGAGKIFKHAPVRHLIVAGTASGLADTIAGMKQLRAVETLEFRESGIDAKAVARLAASPHLRGLTGLILRFARLGDAGTRAVAAATGWTRLMMLDLYDTTVEVAGLSSLAEAPHLTGLTDLILGGNALAAPGASSLAAPSSRFKILRRLHLARSGCGDVAVTNLARSSHFASLRELDLSDNMIGTRGARAIAASPHLQGLECLRLHRTSMGTAGRDVLEQRFGERVKF